MDHLGRRKAAIEAHLFGRLMTLFNLDVSLVFYDTTLAYFEGDGMERLVRFSRKNKRLEKKEILICVIMSKDGFPIYHEVLPGNRNDVSTVVDIVRKLSQRFQIKECIFVGDGGMHSEDNIRVIEKELKYRTIIGVPLRARTVVRDEILRRPGRYHTIKKNLRVKEVDVDGQRYILGFNPEEACREKSRRIHLLKTLQKKIDALPRAKDPVKARAKILADSPRARYLWRPKKKKAKRKDASDKAVPQKDKKKEKEPRLYPLRIDWKRVRRAARYDGKHVIQTNADLTRDEVARAYRDLQRLECCFKHLKSAAIRVRPAFHWRDRRIRAHVLICVMALVIERMLQRRLDDASVDIEAPRALEELAAVRAAVQTIQGKTYRYRNEPTAEVAQILKACKVRLPPRVQEITDQVEAVG
jgi:transposase